MSGIRYGSVNSVKRPSSMVNFTFVPAGTCTAVWFVGKNSNYRFSGNYFIGITIITSSTCLNEFGVYPFTKSNGRINFHGL
jgi:hypothetical protein